MLSLHRTLSLRYLRQRSTRTLLIVASIALGVATLVATRTLSQSMHQAAKQSLNPLAGTADLIVSNGETGVPRGLADKLSQAHIAGLRAITPIVLTRAAVPELDGRWVWLLGVPVPREVAQATDDNALGIEATFKRDPRLARLAYWAQCRIPFSHPRIPVLIGSGLAAELEGKTQGDHLSIRVAGDSQDLEAIGTITIKAEGPSASFGKNAIAMDLDDASRLQFPGRPDFVSQINLVIEPDANRDDVRRSVQHFVANPDYVRTPEAGDQSFEDVTAGLQLGFDIGGAAALVVGLFLVYNALAVNVTERRHDIGILRSLGATRRQVAGLFAGEAALLGFVGALLGVPLGLFLAYLTLGPIQQVLSDIFLPLEATKIVYSRTIILLSMAAGMATALLASVVPALQASTEEPADAVRRAPRLNRWRYRLLQGAAIGLLVGGGMTCISLREWLYPRWGTFGGLVLIMVGTLVASPLLAAIFTRVLQPLARPLLGIEGRLAADNLARSSGRTGLVIGALAASVALLAQTAGTTVSTENALLQWVDDRVAADLFVTSGSPITSGGQAMSMKEEQGAQIANEPDVKPQIEKVLPVRFHQLHNFRDRIVFLIAFDAAQSYEIMRRRTGVSGVDLYPRLHAERGAVLVSDNFAALYRVRVGDSISIDGKDGPMSVNVIGTIADYTWNRGTIFMDWRWYQEGFEDRLADVFHVYLRPGADPDEVRQLIADRWGTARAENLVVLTRAKVRTDIRDLLRRLYNIVYAQQLLVGLVAVLGVVMALLISVLQRRRELGLLRAVGASRAQVLRSVLAEALLIGLIGSLIGLLLGIPLEWYILRVMLLDEAGFIFPVYIPWLAAGVVMGLAVLVSTLAGLGPALHAIGLRIPEAIAYE